MRDHGVSLFYENRKQVQGDGKERIFPARFGVSGEKIDEGDKKKNDLPEKQKGR